MAFALISILADLHSWLHYDETNQKPMTPRPGLHLTVPHGKQVAIVRHLSSFSNTERKRGKHIIVFITKNRRTDVAVFKKC
jgi:hypothetical protein